ncbi:adhesin [Pseudomonas sp. MWU16-30323]|uniref:adhesin n=1 Tax=Pseudomonas sp. MWU16-30323 TaxID=2878094 RepID=UPI001CFB2848|nr:adhesin [Pseudomonas sp. MWU16-30323]
MSNLSVNNFPRLNNDLNQQNADLSKSVDKSAGEIRATTPGTILKNNPAGLTDGTVTFNKDALEKLFEMFEYAFKAIRNMLFGQGGMPELVPDAGLLPKPEKSSDPLVKNKADSNSNVPNTAAKDKSGTHPEVSVQKDKPANNPAVPHSEVKETPKPLPEHRRPDPASGKDVQPNSRSSSDVNVTVRVMSCHCPHPDATKPVPPTPDVPMPVPDVPAPPKFDAPMAPKPGVSLPPKPDAPKPAAPKPDKPEPDITSPGPSEDYFEFESSSGRRTFDSDWRFNPGRRISR